MKKNKKLPVAKAVKIMGILNVTPDSFSDGGRFFERGGRIKKAIARALQMIEEGASIIDVGGESSGPGSTHVPLQEELWRVIPVIAEIHRRAPHVLISVDTYKAEVARQAIAAGARMVNDVTALRGDPKMAPLIAKTGVKVVLMYSKDKTARTTRRATRYKDVVKEILAFLRGRISYARSFGIKKNQIIIDTGMGAFVSTIPTFSYEILCRLREFKKLGCPILVGTSRKSFLPGPLHERLGPTLVSNMIASINGADIIRVHDVMEHRKFFEEF